MTKTAVFMLGALSALSLMAQDAPKIKPETIAEFEQARADYFEVQKRLLEIPNVRELLAQAEQENKRVTTALGKAGVDCGDKYAPNWPAHGQLLACLPKPEQQKQPDQNDTKGAPKKQ